MAGINISELKKNAVKIENVQYPEIDKDFIKQLRNSLNMSQSLFASYLGVTKKAVEKWEQGVNKIKGSTKVLLYLISENPDILSKIIRVEYKGETYKYERDDRIDNNIISFSGWKAKTNNDIMDKKEELRYANACV